MVGIFLVLCLMGLLALTGFALAGDRLLARQQRYVVVYEDGVGLTPGLDVTVSGLVVGKVTSVSLTAERKVAVELAVDEAYAGFVRSDSVATARMTLSGKQVEIGPGTQAPLEPGGRLVAGDNMDPFVVVDAAETLARLAEALGELRGLSADLGLGTGELPQALDDATFLLAQLRAGTGTLGQMIVDPALANELQVTLGELRAASTSLSEASLAVQQAGRSIEDAGSAIEGASTELQKGGQAVTEGAKALDQGMPAIQEGAESIDQTMEEIDATLEELNRSLARMQQILEQLPGVGLRKEAKPKEAP